MPTTSFIKNIQVSAGETISLLANNVTIDASQTVSINAGDDIVLNAGKSLSSYSDEDITFMAGEDISATAKNISTSASENSKHNADTLSLQTETEIEVTSKKVGIDSSKENLVLSTGGDVDTQAKGKVNLF